MKLLFIVLLVAILNGCSSTRKINGIEQTFTEYVILNKHYNGANEVYDARVLASTSPEMFPGLRLRNWIRAKED